ncbi:MAG: metal-binding protein, partial [Cyanobacteria bacterium P01_D01_bin.73]
RITAWGVPMVAAAALGASRDPATTLALTGGFAAGGFFLSPDLDIHSVPYKRWGPFRWIWLPYRKMFRHRSPWTHGLVVGTTIRIVYLMVWVSAAVAIAGAVAALAAGGNGDAAGQEAIATVTTLLRWLWRQPLLWVISAGLELGALSHVTADFLFSKVRRRRAKAKKKPARRRRRSQWSYYKNYRPKLRSRKNYRRRSKPHSKRRRRYF